MDKYEAAARAVDSSHRNYGEEHDIDTLVDELERLGWRFVGWQ